MCLWLLTLKTSSQGKDGIFDSGSTVHVCFHKDMFNSLIAKEEGTVKMVDDLACEVIGTGVVNITVRDVKVLWRQPSMSRRHDTI